MGEKRPVQVAIDGPAGAGKSTVARATAKELGYTYIDTGAMYRAVAYRTLKAGLQVDKDDHAIGNMAGKLQFEFRNIDGEMKLFVDDEDVSEIIRTPEVGDLSSPVSAIPVVREHLVAAQRKMCSTGGTVMEGRDIGTVVLPAAEVKIFLTATPPERARRRYRQLLDMGIDQDINEILHGIMERDRRDSTRAVAPLKKAEGAIEIFSDGLQREDVINRICTLVRQAEQE